MLSILSRWLVQFCLYLSLTSCTPEISSSFLMTSLLTLSSLVYPVTLLRKRISAASRRVMSLSVVTYVSLPYSSDGPATTFKQNLKREKGGNTLRPPNTLRFDLRLSCVVSKRKVRWNTMTDTDIPSYCLFFSQLWLSRA